MSYEKSWLLREGSRSHRRVKILIFVQMICSKPPVVLYPNLVVWCIIMQEFIWLRRDHVYCIFWTADPFATKLCLIVYYHKPECFMEKFDCCPQGHGHSKISNCPDDIFWNTESFTAKLVIVMHHYESDCLSKGLVCCLQGQGHSYG